MLERVARASEKTCVPWSSGLGHGEASPKGGGSLDEGLRAMAGIKGRRLFVVLDAHRLLDDPVATRRLRDLLPTLRASPGRWS